MTRRAKPEEVKPPRSRPAGRDKASSIHIDSHRALLADARRVIARLQAQPELLPLLGVNPVLAFRAAGVTLTPAVADHVLRTFRLSPKARAERDQLESSLLKVLGETPKPLEPAWLAHLIFKTLSLAPLNTDGQTPAYRSALDAETTGRLAQLLPPTGDRGNTSSGAVRTAVRLVLPDTANRLDLDAPVPALPAAGGSRTAISLEEAWFYKDESPVVRDALRLALIDRTAVPVASTARFRQVQKGEVSHPFTTWISGVTFPTVKHS